jgi:hypothetical protein
LTAKVSVDAWPISFYFSICKFNIMSKELTTVQIEWLVTNLTPIARQYGETHKFSHLAKIFNQTFHMALKPNQVRNAVNSKRGTVLFSLLIVDVI